MKTENKTMRTIPTEYGIGATPTFKHDCTSCLFLGQRDGFDIYFCGQMGSPTIIARFGDEGPEYASGANFITSGAFFADGKAVRDSKVTQLAALLPIRGIPSRDTIMKAALRDGPQWENVAASVIVAYVLHNSLLKVPTNG